METLKNRHEIKLKKPARYWDDGLPIGNGRLGAMVMGKSMRRRSISMKRRSGMAGILTGKIRIPENIWIRSGSCCLQEK